MNLTTPQLRFALRQPGLGVRRMGFLSYTSSKEVVVSDKRVVITYWVTFLAILTYIVGYQVGCSSLRVPQLL